MRNISFSLTEPQFIDGSKDVTRRLGWVFLKTGDRLMGCRKVMGRKNGEPLVKLGAIEVVGVRREPLRRMSDDVKYGFSEIFREGFAEHKTLRWPSVWVHWFCTTHGARVTPDTFVTRIVFKHITL